jgi:hypothetical protein
MSDLLKGVIWSILAVCVAPATMAVILDKVATRYLPEPKRK